jgi:hypothetical protein
MAIKGELVFDEVDFSNQLDQTAIEGQVEPPEETQEYVIKAFLDDSLIQIIGRQFVKPTELITKVEIEEFLAEKLDEVLRGLKERLKPNSKVSTKETQRRILEHCKKGFKVLTTPLIGCTDKELMQLTGLDHNTVRWARYNLVRTGFLTQGGFRGSTHEKFWVATDKAKQNEHS